MSEDRLAILGGDPVRTKPFVVGPMTDAEEERAVVEAVRGHHFSRYVSAAAPGLDEVLRLPSREAVHIEADWHFLGGPNVRHFAAEFAEAFGAEFAIPISNCTSGLSAALAAARVGPGDEVIVPAMSFSATGTAVLLFGSVPVFVDVDERTFCIDPDAIERAITPRTKAILVVHLLGNACDMERIGAIARHHDLRVIEDCAQAPGTRWRGRPVGTLGDAGVFSFQQSKNITTGEGGMVLTDDPEIARRIRLILNHGEIAMEDHHSDADLVNIVGCNFRMPELCAAVGRAQLRKLEAVNEWRNRNWRVLVDRLGGLPGFTPPYVPQEVDFACHVAAFLYDGDATGIERELLVAALRAEGVPVGTGYVRLMYENPMFLRRIAFGAGGAPWATGAAPSTVTYRHGQCPVAEQLIYEKFLWFYHVAYPSTPDDMEDVARAVEKVFADADALKAARHEILGTDLGARAQGRINS